MAYGSDLDTCTVVAATGKDPNTNEKMNKAYLFTVRQLELTSSSPSDTLSPTPTPLPTPSPIPGSPSTAGITYLSTSSVPFNSGVASLSISGLDPADHVSSVSVSCSFSDPTLPPPFASSVAGYYDASSWTGSQWSDLSGNSRHATQIRGSPNVTMVASTNVLGGGMTDGIVIPASVMNASTTAYTLVHGCRYTSTDFNNGPKWGRIIDGTTQVGFVSGFYSQLRAVSSRMGGWITPSDSTTNPGQIDDWLLSVDRPQNYRGNGLDLTTCPTCSNSPADQIGVNYGYYTFNGNPSQQSEWQCSFVLVYDRELSDSEVEEVEVWARLRYPGVTFPGATDWQYTTLVPQSASSVIALVGKAYGYSFPGPIRASTTYTSCVVQLANSNGTATASPVTFTTTSSGGSPALTSPPSAAGISYLATSSVPFSSGVASLNISGLDPADQVHSVSVTCPPVVNTTLDPPFATSIVGFYDASSWTGSQWNDLSGNGQHAATIRGAPSVATVGTIATNVMTGTTADGISIPSTVMSASRTSYTVAHACRYTATSLGANTKGILMGTNMYSTWFSGHLGGQRGVSKHGDRYITSQKGVPSAINDWILSVDEPMQYRVNGRDRTCTGTFMCNQSPNQSPTSDTISVNYGASSGYYSDWQCAFVLVYDRELSDSEAEEVEAWARLRYPGVTYPSFDWTFTTPVDASATSVVAQVFDSKLRAL
eukprot:tig00000158_g10195.t1